MPPTRRRPPVALEVAHILREGADAYRRRIGSRPSNSNALVSCRTAALGGFKSHCNAERRRFSHRAGIATAPRRPAHPMGRAPVRRSAQYRPLARRPHELNPIAQSNPALIYRLLFREAEFGRNPRWLGGDRHHHGAPDAAHPWHLRRPLSPDREHSAPRGFLFPKSALSKVCKYLESLTAAHRCGELRMPGDDSRHPRLRVSANHWVGSVRGVFIMRKYATLFADRETLMTELHPCLRPVRH